MESKYTPVKLEELLKYRKEFIKIDDASIYKRVTAKLHAQGIFLRDEIEGLEIKTKNQQLCKSGDFLVAEIDAKVGGFGIVPEKLEGSIVSSHYFLFEIDETKLNSQFLNYYLKTDSFQNQINAQGSTNYAAVRPLDIFEIEIFLPPLKEQKRIVTLLDRVMGRIIEARKYRALAIEELEEMYESILNTSLISDSYELHTLNDVCLAVIDNLHSTPRYDGNEYLCIRSQDVGFGTINYSTALRTSQEEFTERTRRGEPSCGDIVYVREGDVGRCAIVDGSHRFSLGQRVMMFRPNPEVVESKYLMYQLISPYVHKEQILNSMTGTTSRHVNIKKLKEVKLFIPSLLIQQEIVSNLDSLRAKIEELKKLNVETECDIEKLLSSILQKAFAGEL